MNRAEAMEKIISLLAPSELMDSIKDAVDQYNAKDMPEPRKSKKLTPEDFIRKGWKLWHEFTEVNDSRSFLLSIFMKGNQFALLREETGTATKIALSGDGFYDDELDPIISGINRCINADKIPLPAKPKPLVKPKLQSPVVKFYKQGWEEILDDGEGNVILLEKEGKYLLVQRNGKSKSISKHEAIQFFSQFMHPSLAKDITDAVDAYSSKKPEYKIAA
ncbi:hypothetical protein QQ056_17585 [Oscillatoria laete-virens NRMC-F 0139]|nr:hypothetical protein [Oscillatoria laete-virens NRMC-F 0139]